jgi:hypothetical protein
MNTFKYEFKMGLTDWLIILGGILALMVSCNPPISLKPAEFSSPDSTVNYNFKALPDNDYYRANSSGVYMADIELYLRSFQKVNPNHPILLQFKTNNFGVFILKKDTLYPDDEIKLKLSDFQNYRFNGQFYTNILGKQSLDFNMEIGKTKKQAKANFETK